MPPKGVKTRTVASSFHIRRPERGRPAERSAAAGSTLKEVSCGESAENETVLPLTFASDCGAALSAGLHPTRDRQSREMSKIRRPKPEARRNYEMRTRLKLSEKWEIVIAPFWSFRKTPGLVGRFPEFEADGSIRRR